MENDRPRLYTGFSRLDDCLGGLEGGDVIVMQDASVIVLFWNSDVADHSKKGLAVVKNRQGELMKEKMEFIGESMTFSELGEWDHEFKLIQQKTPFDD